MATVSNLAICLTRVPGGLRVRQVRKEDAAAVAQVIREMESACFGISQSNETEVIGTLRSAALHAGRGTAALFDGRSLVAALLVHDDVAHERGLYCELIVSPTIPRRAAVIQCLLNGAQAYGHVLDAPPETYLKTESLVGDGEMEEVVQADGYRQHRTYLRMRLDFTSPPTAPRLPDGLRVITMTDDHWPDVKQTIDESFADHYDYHSLPLDVFRDEMTRPYNAFARWQLVFDGQRCVAVCLSGDRYAPDLGYVDTLGVVPSHRRRGIAHYLLRRAFHDDAAAGFNGTALHCDATNPTGANQLYEQLGMKSDMQFRAWRMPLGLAR